MFSDVYLSFYTLSALKGITTVLDALLKIRQTWRAVLFRHGADCCFEMWSHVPFDNGDGARGVKDAWCWLWWSWESDK